MLSNDKINVDEKRSADTQPGVGKKTKDEEKMRFKTAHFSLLS